MHRVKFNPQAWAVTRGARRLTQPVILMSSAVVGASIANTHAQPINCQQRDTLELANEPYRSSHLYDASRHNDTLHSGVHPAFRRQHFRGGAHVDKEEDLVPAVLYIAGAGLLGSFFARKRNFIVRFLSPMALALGAAAYTVPKTTNNLIQGLKFYDYSEIGREAEHKAYHLRDSAISAKNAVVDAAEGTVSTITSGLGVAEQKTKEAVHDLEGKAHKLQDKASHVLGDLKEGSPKAVKELKNKSDEVGKDVKSKSKEVVSKTQPAAENLKNDAEASAEKAKHWFESNVDEVKNNLPKEAASAKRSPQEAGQQAKDWIQRNTPSTHDEWQRAGRDARDEVERGVDRLRQHAQGGYEQARRSLDTGRDEAEGAFRRAHHDIRDRYKEARDQGEHWARQGRDKFEEARRDWGRRAREGQDYVDDKLREGRQYAETKMHEGRDYTDAKLREGRQIGQEEYDRYTREREGPWSPWGGWGGHDYDRRYSRGRGGIDSDNSYFGRPYYHADHHYHQRPYNEADYQPRRSVSEMAREEGRQSWERARNAAADPYESYDRSPFSSRQWWNTNTSPSSTLSPSFTHQFEDSFDHAKDSLKKNAETLKNQVDDKMEEDRRWWQGQAKEWQRGVDLAKSQAQEYSRKAEDYGRKVGDRMRDSFENQGRDFGMGGARDYGKNMPHYHHHPHNPHGDIYSDDNWFHYEPSHAHRRGERGL